jgi:hypothetical protein
VRVGAGEAGQGLLVGPGRQGPERALERLRAQRHAQDPRGSAGPGATGASRAAAEDGEAGEPGTGEAGRGGLGLGLTERTDALESEVAGMVLYERVIIALRRLAQEDASARRFRPAAVD